MLADRILDLLGRSHDLVAGVEISAFTLGHQARPATCDQCARARAGDAWRSVDPARPIGGNEVLVGAELLVSVKNDGVTFGREAVLVSIAADASDAFKGEIEWDGGIACAGEEGNEEGAETAVDVKWQPAFSAES